MEAWGKRHKRQDDYLRARDGDHILAPFECDLCVFRKLRGHSPCIGNSVDDLLLGCIRRANLDVFWSRATSTVQSNTRLARNAYKLSNLVGLNGFMNHIGPLPPYDHCGYEVAIVILLASRKPGRYSTEYTQYETIRKYRSCYSNQVRASPQANHHVLALGNTKGAYQRLSTDVCGSLWFQKFNEGCKNRMGQIWRPNRGMPIELLLLFLKGIEQRIEGNTSRTERHKWIVLATYISVTYVLSLRGAEGLLLDLGGINTYWERGDGTYIIVPLLGKIKGEQHDVVHKIPCVPVTSSGINVKAQLERLRSIKADLRYFDGPAISDSEGKLLSAKDLDEMVIEILHELFVSHQELFPGDITEKKHIQQYYQCFRTFRKTSDTRALEAGVAREDITTVNRWRENDKAQGKRPNRSMVQHYAEFDILLQPFKRYTWAM